MQKVEKYKYKNAWTANIKWCTIPALLAASLLFTSLPTKAERYAWQPTEGVITMDVVKNDGARGGGTWLCKSLKDCYIKVLEAEERGATLDCQTIDIKKDGKTVWHRNYSDPYWVRSQRIKSHERGWFRK